ncbi:MAG: helix-hairpin-helix domain-containing protein [Chloroflexi bacterium]|nr:helix-hairpin-helix domain-containing protein [Chloroflexota bacterium]
MTEQINLNTAHLDALTNLPGVGPAMAERIVAARPYQAPEDLLHVSGVGPALLERLTPLVTVAEDETPDMEIPFEEDSGTQPEAEEDIPETESQPEEEVAPPEAESQPEEEAAPPETESQTEEEAAPQETEFQPEEEAAPPETEFQPEDEIIPPWDDGEPEDEIHPPDAETADDAIIPAEADEEKSPSRPKPVTRGQALLMAAVGSFAAFVLAVLFSLILIASLNGGLRFASLDQVAALDRQVSGLNSQAEILTQDIAGLQSRIDNLETLNVRVDNLETDTAQLETDMSATVESVENMSVQIEDMSAQIEEIFSQTARFQAFLNGLRELLNALGTP